MDYGENKGRRLHRYDDIGDEKSYELSGWRWRLCLGKSYLENWLILEFKHIWNIR